MATLDRTLRPSRQSSFISRTARSMPTSTARPTMACPMFSSSISSMRSDRQHVLVVEPVAGRHPQAQLGGRLGGVDDARQLAPAPAPLRASQ